MQIIKPIKITLSSLMAMKSEFEKEKDIDAVKECDLNISLFEKVSSLFKSKESEVYGILRGTPRMEYYMHLSPDDFLQEKEFVEIFNEYGISANIQKN